MFSETIELRGHIIDSLILPKVLDQILTHGANFKIGEITIGQKRADQSFARIEVSAETSDALDELILQTATARRRSRRTHRRTASSGSGGRRFPARVLRDDEPANLRPR